MKTTIKAGVLKKMITEVIQAGVANMGLDSQLDDATQLLMMVAGRIMAAKDKPVPPEVIDQTISSLEQIDGLLAKHGLEAGDAPLDEMTTLGVGGSVEDVLVKTIQQRCQKISEAVQSSKLAENELRFIGSELWMIEKKLTSFAFAGNQRKPSGNTISRVAEGKKPSAQ